MKDQKSLRENILIELQFSVQWVCYRLEDQGREKPAKVPYNPITGRKANVNNPSTWCSFEEALEKMNQYDGLGFVFSKHDPYCGIDLDFCIEGGIILPWAKEIIKYFNSYTEYSPSGTGVHIIIKAKKKSKRCRKFKIEVYDLGRFFAMTGNIVKND